MRTAALVLAFLLGLAAIGWAIVRMSRKPRQAPVPLASLDFLRSIEIDAPQIAVWDFCYQPANGALTEDDCVEGITVPGTPQGQVGERQSFTYVSGGQRRTRTIKVVHLIPRHEATTVPVDDHSPQLSSRTTTRVTGTAGGRTLLTLIQGFTVTEAMLELISDEFVDENLAWMDDYLRRVKEHVEARRLPTG